MRGWVKPVVRVIEVGAWTGFFAFAALVLALRFWLLPEIERFRGEIAGALSHAIGQPVTIGAIEAGWLGLRPQLHLSDVRIHDAGGREALVLPAVENIVSWRTLLDRELRLHSLVIDQPRLEVRRDAAGALFIAGMKLSETRGESGFTDWLLAQEEIVVRGAEIEWRDERRGAPPLALSALDFRLRNAGNEHFLGLSARPPEALGAHLELRAELIGHSIADLDAWNGRLYAELGYTDLAAWRAWIDYPVEVRQGQGALRLWITLENGALRRATADFELAEVVARLGSELPLLELASLHGRLQGGTRGAGFELAGKALALAARRGPSLSPADFRLAWQPRVEGVAEHGAFSASQLELQPLAQLADALPFPDTLRRQLAELSPRGRLLEAKADWQGPLAELERLSVRTRFIELAAAARNGMPGFSGLSGSAEFTRDLGTLSLASRQAELELPGVLRRPRVQLDALTGNLEWERVAPRTVKVRLSSLSFANEHLSGSAQGAYTHTGEGPGTIDLSAQLAHADGRHTAAYLPKPEILGAETHEWLVRAIVAGRASDARLRLKGDLRDFPFRDPGKGQFQVSARVSNGVLDYASGWPRIHDIEGELLFERDRIEIAARAAAILGTKLSHVRVSLPGLGAEPPKLSVSGQAEGPSAEFLRYIAASPVRRMTSGFTERIGASGRGRLSLKLTVPLGNPDATTLAGEYDFANNTVSVHPQLPPIERATGRVSFTESGLTLHDIRGRLFGGALALSGGSRAGSGLELVAKGEAVVDATRALLDHPWLRHLSGTAPYVATVNVREGHTHIGFESSLRGVASTLPAPLAKAPGEALALRVDVIPAEDGGRDRISVALGRIAAAEFLRRRQGAAMAVQRASVSLSPTGEALRLPERPGTLVYGSLPALDLDRWLALREDSGDAVHAAMFDVRFGALDVFGKRLNNVSVRAGADAVGWSATVNADELAGDLSYRGQRGGQLIARLQHLRIPEERPGERPAEASQAKEFPAVDVIAERFSYRGKQLGRIELLAQHAGPDWRIDKIAMVNPEASLTGKGLWHTAAPSRTALEFQLTANDGGKFLDRIGYADLVRGAKTQLRGTLAWNGDPATLDYATLAGELELRAEEGQFLEIEPGLGKLVSLMSMQALPKRIALDFRDVFSKGFQFDRIAAAARVEGGVMTLREFKMRGSAAEVEMSGETDLAHETQKLHVRVVPSLGDSTSTVVGLVNPLAGVASVIAQRVLKNPLGQMFAFEYAITGTWSDPKVAKVYGGEAQPPLEK